MAKGEFMRKKGKLVQNGIDENILKNENSRTCSHKIDHPGNSPIGGKSIKWAIMCCLFNHFSVSTMSRKMHKTRVTIRKYLKELNSEGCCLYSSSSWKLTIKGRKFLDDADKATPLALPRKVVNFRNKSLNFLSDRCHNVKFKVPVVAKPSDDDWLKTWQKYAIRNNSFYILRDNVSSGQVCTTYTGNNLIIQMPISRAENPVKIIDHLRSLALCKCKEYELRFGICLNSAGLTLIGQHHAFQQEPFSKACKGEGISKSINEICVDSPRTPLTRLLLRKAHLRNLKGIAASVLSMKKVFMPKLSV
jgi:hypothetical protein